MRGLNLIIFGLANEGVTFSPPSLDCPNVRFANMKPGFHVSTKQRAVDEMCLARFADFPIHSV